MIKNILTTIALTIFISSCSNNITQSTSMSTSNKYLTEMDKKYPYLPIKLKEFVVTDKDSSSKNPTSKISIEEKAHVLEAISIMRFVINTPEFRDEFFNGICKFEAASDGSGTRREIKKGAYYDKNIVFNMLKNAAITTYILKDDIGGDANALGTLGPRFYLNVDANYPIIEGDKNNLTSQDLLIFLPNNIYWADTNTIYGDKYRFSQIIFHELIHNLGFNHLNDSPNEIQNQYDTADKMEDIFREVINEAWRAKYKTELEQYNYYQTKYKSFLKSTTTPK